MIRRLHRLARDRRGATLTEFGLVAPVLCLGLLGFLDIGHSLYMRSVVQGQLQKAARDSGLESGLVDLDKIDESVRAQALAMNSANEPKFERRYYRTFSAASAAKREPFSDDNKNGRCDAGEPYEDQNSNSRFDADGGDDGQGGAKDAVLYTVKIKYPRLFPMASVAGLKPDIEYQASMILANQPYGDQGTYGPPKVRNCP